MYSLRVTGLIPGPTVESVAWSPECNLPWKGLLLTFPQPQLSRQNNNNNNNDDDDTTTTTATATAAAAAAAAAGNREPLT